MRNIFDLAPKIDKKMLVLSKTSKNDKKLLSLSKRMLYAPKR